MDSSCDNPTMKSTLRGLLLSVILTTLLGQITEVKCDAQKSQEQTSFCEEGSPADVKLNGLPLPPPVVAAVINSREGKQATASALASGTQLDPAKLLTGVRAHLSDSKARFFLVSGGDTPLSGGDNTWFWIVRESDHKASSILWAGANCLEIKRTKTHGLSDIVAHWSSAAVTTRKVYKFDGKSYRLAQSRSRTKSLSCNP
jgi:hypothetical protein